MDAVGPDVTVWQAGDRVGLGFLGGHCGECTYCRRGDFVNGGYAEIVYARATGLVAVPDKLDPLDAAPLLCAGITVFNALRNAGAPPGALVAIQGIGGLGHLGVAVREEARVPDRAIARGQDKAELARKLGADDYIDSAATDRSW